MTGARLYLLDTNVCIQAARHYYAFDIAPLFWVALIEQAANGRVRSIDRVKTEIDKGNDDLKDCTDDNFHQWFESTDADDVVEAYADIMLWASQQAQFTDAAKAEFAGAADGWLVAFARARGYVVVTLERFDPLVRRRIPIPNVCEAFDVEQVDTFELLRALGVTLG